MKGYIRKIIYIVVFILADIVIFALLSTAGNALIGNRNNYSEVISTETGIYTTGEITTEIETTTAEHNALYEKSSSPFVNWMRNIVINIRN